MTKMTLDHVGAIEQSLRLMYPYIEPNMKPRARKELDDDITRLKEIRALLLREIYAPHLPTTVNNVDEPESHGCPVS